MISSGLQTGTASVQTYTGPCRLLGVSFSAAVDTITTITVYANTVATADATHPIVAYGVASGGSLVANKEFGAHNFVIKFSRDDNMFCETGLRTVMSATTGSYIIYFERM